jgi:hypothetical protein
MQFAESYKKELIHEFKSVKIHMRKDWIRTGEELVSKELTSQPHWKSRCL